MTKALVIQSHRQPLPYPWISTCLDSVKYWAEVNNLEYQFIGDELFDYAVPKNLKKTAKQIVIATDLARLYAMQDYLAQGYETVIWCDADFLIFAPEKLALPEESYAIGREVWVQRDNDKLTAYVKVHNAFMMFRKDNPFLDFYTDTAERFLAQNTGRMPPQFIGPKLLTAIHNVAQCPVLETAGMLSPLVVKDITNAGGPALDLFQRRSPKPIAAANLCSSSIERGEISEQVMEKCIEVLISGLLLPG